MVFIFARCCVFITVGEMSRHDIKNLQVNFHGKLNLKLHPSFSSVRHEKTAKALSYVNGDQQSIEKLDLTSRQAEESVQLGNDGKEDRIENKVEDEFDQMVQNATAILGSHRDLKLIEKCTIELFFSLTCIQNSSHP